ncbi:MAG TPA: hypothetical protein VGH02_04355 [Rhizomicrobium sp.]|jgi:hypothetical protein
MQLKLQRSQRRGMTGKVLFCLDIRADYSPEERTNINRYAIGGEVIYMIDDAPSPPFSADVLAPELLPFAKPIHRTGDMN